MLNSTFDSHVHMYLDWIDGWYTVSNYEETLDDIDEWDDNVPF